MLKLLLFLVVLLRFDSVPRVQFALAQPHSSAQDQTPSIHAPAIHASQLIASSSLHASTHQRRRRFFARNRIRLPFNGSVNALPVQFACEFALDNTDDFYHRYRNQLLCIEIDANWRHCSPTRNEPPLFDSLPSGTHSAVAYLLDTEDSSERLLESELIVFTVLHRQEHQEYVERRKREDRERLAIEEDEDLLTWASKQASSTTVRRQQELNPNGGIVQQDTVRTSKTSSNVTDDASQEDQQPPPILVIGVKTSVLRGFVSRQAIRDTWASEISQEALGFRVFFVGCQPVISDTHLSQRDGLIRAIEMEKQHFGDLLTDELECEDSYFTLPTKVKQFLHFAATKFPHVPYVMIADDDIYLRVDQLTQALRHHGSRKRFYAGQVWAKQFLSPVVPMRNPAHKNYLPEAQYPMSTLLPFVFGPHYILSMDCAEYIGENHKELGDFMSLDDVSVALWLLALQVHPEHVPSFQNLRDITCKEGFVSFADLTPHAIRVIHANLQGKALFCRGFDIATWLKSDQAAVNAAADGDEPEKPKRTVRMTSNVNLASEELQVITRLSMDDGVNMGSTKDFGFDPSRESFVDHCAAITKYLDEQQIPYSDVSVQIRAVMTRSLTQAIEDRKVSSAFVELWRHNLQLSVSRAGLRPSMVTIVYSHKGAYSKVLLECLFTAIYEEKATVQVLDEATFYQQQSKELTTKKEPDVFVFSILDGGINCTSAWSAPCQQAASQVIERYGKSSQLVMIAGETWEVDNLDERVLLISTVSQVLKREKHVYIPMASMAFGETVTQSPMLLLASRRARRSVLSIDEPYYHQPRKFCAYMYARCDRPQREYMFDLLNAMEHVDALGVCQGSAQQEKTERWRARWSASAFEDAIKIYSNYKFVIAFENAQQQPGYVTEKIINAYLAGSIPIYLGHSNSVTQLFNPRSFIDCGRFATLRKCAERVIEVHQSAELYEAMLNEPVIGNVTLFHELFSWHPDVPSSFLASKIASLLSR